MIELYKKAFFTFIILAAITCIVGYVCVDKIYLNNQLVPIDKNTIPWKSVIRTDKEDGGDSFGLVKDDKYSLDVDFNVKPNTPYPYASIAMVFTDKKGKEQFIDFSRYHSLSLTIKCAPHNVLLFAVFTVDENTTKLDDLLTYRTTTTFLS